MSGKDNVRILAIDPGYDRLGVAIIETSNNRAGQKPTLLFSDCVTSSKKLPHAKRLLEIGEAIRGLLEKWRPTELAIESLFFNQNQKTALLVAEARGVVLFEAARHGLTVFSYTPGEIKVAVTSYGRSDKKQIKTMIGHLVEIKKQSAMDDEYDAVAVGLTHIAHRKGRAS